MAMFAYLIGFALIAYSNALTVGRFQNVSDGIWEAWNDTDPANVKQGRFGLEYGNGNLWLVSRRLYRKNTDHPWDPAVRGGIVSTFHTANKAWSHKPYDRLDEDLHGDKLFSLNGRLFMLSYSTSQNKIGFHKLFFWDDESGRWLDTPFDIDPTATTVSTNAIQSIAVTVPDQNGKVAYFVASSHGYASRGSEMVYSRLDVDFRGNVPVKASLKTIAREQSNEPRSVVYTAMKDDILYALVQDFYSEGYVPNTEFAYAVNLKTNQVNNVTLAGAGPPMDFDGERMFQTRDEIFMVGGMQIYGLGQVRDVKDIWSLNLGTFQWRGTNALIPEGSGNIPAYDQQNGNLYLAGLKEGISVAKLSA